MVGGIVMTIEHDESTGAAGKGTGELRVGEEECWPKSGRHISSILLQECGHAGYSATHQVAIVGIPPIRICEPGRTCGVASREASQWLHQPVHQRTVAASEHCVKCVEEAVFTDLRLVRIVGSIQMDSFTSQIIQLPDDLLGQFVLDPKAPHICLGWLPIGVDNSN